MARPKHVPAPIDCDPDSGGCGAELTVTYRWDNGFVNECRVCGKVTRCTSSGPPPAKVVTGGGERRQW